jgi:hypothetical protein
MAYQLDEGEELLATYRVHELTLLPTVLEVFILIFIPGFLAIRSDYFYASQPHLTLFLYWTILVALFAAFRFIWWATDYYVLTSKRLVYIHFTKFLRRTADEIAIKQITKIDCLTENYFAKIFNWGDLQIYIGGRSEPFVMRKMENPELLKTKILQQK